MSTGAFIDDLATHLQTHGIGTKGASLFVGQLPAVTTLATQVVEYGGMPANRARDVEFPQVQVTVRGADFDQVRDKAFAAYDLLTEPTAPVASGASSWLYCKAMQRPTPLGVDDRGLWRFVCNFRFWLNR